MVLFPVPAPVSKRTGMERGWYTRKDNADVGASFFLQKHPQSASLGVWVFTGYVVGGQNFVGNWRMTTHPGEPVMFEGAFAMSKRE